MGFFAVLKNFDIIEQMDVYLAKNPDQKEEYQANFHQFVAYLSELGYIEDVDYTPIWLGAYSTFEDKVDN